MIDFLKEFWEFLRERKKYWLLPIIIVLALFGILIVLSQGSAVAHLFIQYFSDFYIRISAFYHDSAAAIIIDGNIIAAAQEERFSRKKHDPRYPFHAVICATESNLSLNEVDHIVFFEKLFLKLKDF